MWHFEFQICTIEHLPKPVLFLLIIHIISKTIINIDTIVILSQIILILPRKHHCRASSNQWWVRMMNTWTSLCCIARTYVDQTHPAHNTEHHTRQMEWGMTRRTVVLYMPCDKESPQRKKRNKTHKKWTNVRVAESNGYVKCSLECFPENEIGLSNRF